MIGPSVLISLTIALSNYTGCIEFTGKLVLETENIASLMFPNNSIQSPPQKNVFNLYISLFFYSD